MRKRQPKVPISLCLIGRNCEKEIQRFHRQVVKPLLLNDKDEVIFVDTASTDKTVAEAKKRGWHVIDGKRFVEPRLLALAKQIAPKELERWIDHPHIKGGILRSFAEARERSFAAARNRVVMWLDLDDKLVEPENLRLFIDHCFGDPKRHGAIFLPYDYAFDQFGNCILTLWRERIVSKEDYEWRGACHEVLCPKKGREKYINFMARDPNAPFRVQHLKPPASHFSDLRNYVIMYYDWYIRDNQDPRTLFYLGNACRGLERWLEAIGYYEQFVKLSGNFEDIFIAYLSWGQALMKLGRFWEAIDVADKAQKIKPTDPRPLYFKAECWYRMRNWKAAIECIRQGEGRPIPDTLHAVDPTGTQMMPPMIAALAAREMGDVELAMHYATKARQAAPNDQVLQQAYHDFIQWARAEKIVQAQAVAVNTAKDKIDVAKLLVISPHAADKGFGVPETAVPGGYSGKKTLAIYCPHTSTRWGPLTDGRGLGASEKMVWLMAKRLAKRGLAVTVYCRLADPPGKYDGVEWRHYATYNPKLYRDYILLWRAPQLLAHTHFACGKLYVWMHDVGFDTVWTPDVLKQVNKVLFLSKFHRSKHPSVPESKVYYTRNGIDLDLHLWNGEKEEKKIVYMSCPTRGWLTTCEIFNESKLAEEGYELHLFYGFTEGFDDAANQQIAGYIPDLDREYVLRDYQAECLRVADKSPGIVRRGMVNWHEIAQELKTAKVWLYPTRFDEISCVAAMEAQAAGCLIMATDSGALAETLAGYKLWVNPGKIDVERWAKVLRRQIMWDRRKMSEAARRFDIETLADEWMRDLFVEVKHGECKRIKAKSSGS